MRCFTLFASVFFNRGASYYPVYALLFLDFGLTLEHFSGILKRDLGGHDRSLSEVPSGRSAIRSGGDSPDAWRWICMVVEMGVFAVRADAGRGLCFSGSSRVNRDFVSGLAEKRGPAGRTRRSLRCPSVS